MAPVSARFCQEHESLIRWLQSWVAGNQEVGAPVNWGQVSVSKGAASHSAQLGAGPCRAKRYHVALTGHCEQCRAWALKKAPGDFSSSGCFLKCMSRAVGKMTWKPSPALAPLWIASWISLAGCPIGTLVSSCPQVGRNCQLGTPWNTQSPMQILQKYWLDERMHFKSKNHHFLPGNSSISGLPCLSLTSPSSLSSCSSIFSLLIPYRSTSPLHSTAISRESILHSLPTQTALDQSHSVLCSTLLPPDLKPPVVQHKLRLLCLAFKVHPWPLSSFCIICFSSECLLLLPSWPRLIPQTHPGFICPYIWAHIPVHTHLSSSTNPGFDPLSYHWVENLVELTLQDYVVMYV